MPRPLTAQHSMHACGFNLHITSHGVRIFKPSVAKKHLLLFQSDLCCVCVFVCLATAGWTPLMYASYVGHDTIVNLLLDAGVDPSYSTPGNLSPLMVAAGCGNESVCYFLIQVGGVATGGKLAGNGRKRGE